MLLRRLLALIAITFTLALSAGEQHAYAQSVDAKLLARLSDEQRDVYANWRAARQAFERQNEAYWSAVSARRAERRRKISAGERVTPAEFVMEMPPKYMGPSLRPDIAKIQAELADPPSSERASESEITTLPEMLEAARQHYRFAPSLVPEREFKRRYAVEALALGLTKEEVTRIYAFETGGRGTFDMQAGINPDTKAGRAISTAMGYAQLLAANSIDELSRSGDGFIQRLSMLAAAPGTPPQRVQELTAKIEAVRAMLRTVRSVPKEWSRHVELARTPKGYAVHVLNLDGDIGPWLQVIKLKGIKNTAESSGKTSATPAELEIMNLSGPRTGLEMMEPVGRMAPTSNFFSQAAYYRNTIVREKTAAELLTAIDGRMTENMTRPGSIEFAAVFDEVAGRATPAKFDNRQQLLPASASRPAASPVAAPRPSAYQPPYTPPPAPRLQPVQLRPELSRPAQQQAIPTPEGLIPPAPIRAARPPQAETAPTNPAPTKRWGPASLAPLGFPD